MKNIQAVLFDMDGTLVDSEALTERALLALLPDLGIDPSGLDLTQFHGVTWRHIAGRLQTLFPVLGTDDRSLAAAIEARFQGLFIDEPPDLIPGAVEAFRAAAARFPGAVTIVTGSEARAVEHLLERTGLRELCTGWTSCDQYEHSKPDPQSYLLAAQRLGVPARACLVFEDSLPGLEAARAAGMWCVAVTRGEPARIAAAADRAHAAIDDFTQWPAERFDEVAAAG